MFEVLSDKELDSLAAELGKLLKIEIEFSSTAPRTIKVGGSDLLGLRDKIREWLKILREVAREFGPSEFTLQAGVGFTPGLYASFTWPLASQERGEDKP